MIQHTIRVLCIFIVLTISISAQKQPNFAPEAYKKLGNLAGDWVGKDDEGAEVKSNFKLAISNTVVMETLNASGMEEMLTKMDTPHMLTRIETLLFSGLLLCSWAAAGQTAKGPDYTADGQLRLPENYREWVYLTSGFDMSYNPGLQMPGHHMFDNVFVDPVSYKAFVEIGTWPDKTLLVLEARMAEGKGSINQQGNYQGVERMGLEVHVKDTARFREGWAFLGFDDKKLATMVPVEASCYTCHASHAAVDTTFVQFYPTLLPIAKSKGTLSAVYQKESAAATK